MRGLKLGEHAGRDCSKGLVFLSYSHRTGFFFNTAGDSRVDFSVRKCRIVSHQFTKRMLDSIKIWRNCVFYMTILTSLSDIVWVVVEGEIHVGNNVIILFCQFSKLIMFKYILLTERWGFWGINLKWRLKHIKKISTLTRGRWEDSLTACFRWIRLSFSRISFSSWRLYRCRVKWGSKKKNKINMSSRKRNKSCFSSQFNETAELRKWKLRASQFVSINFD